MEFINFLFVFLILAVVIAYNAVVQIPQGYAFTLERFGRYIQTLPAGISLIVPFIDKVGARINLMERVLDVPSQEVISRDNAMVRVDGVCFFKVIEPSYAAYRVLDLEKAISNIIITNIRTVLGALDLDGMLSQRDLINERLLNIIDQATEDWGVKVTRIEIKDIRPPSDLVEAMASQMKAEREKRARILEAEGFKQSEILKAEGVKQATVLQAEAKRSAAFLESEARERQAEAEAVATTKLSDALAKGNQQALNYYIAQQYIKSFATLASSSQSKMIFMPFESSQMLASLGGIKELFSKFEEK
jgi:regulator of protease activity HflC (stomatin/prohibitin superfamily)